MVYKQSFYYKMENMKRASYYDENYRIYPSGLTTGTPLYIHNKVCLCIYFSKKIVKKKSIYMGFGLNFDTVTH